MNESNLALQLQVIEPSTDLESVMIGTSYFTDDVWDLRDFIPSRSMQECLKHLRFDKIDNAITKSTVKQYAYYKLGKVKPQTVI